VAGSALVFTLTFAVAACGAKSGFDRIAKVSDLDRTAIADSGNVTVGIGACPPMENVMANPEVNENAAQNQKRQPGLQPGDKPKQQRLQGKSVQVNQNSLHEGDPIESATPKDK